ncbi:MAG: TPM domain-containing protein [bacterium]
MKNITLYIKNIYSYPIKNRLQGKAPDTLRILTWILIFITLFSCFSLISAGSFALAQNEPAFPKPRGYVTDLAGLLTPQTASHLENLITYINQKTTAEVAVVILNSIGPYTIEDYAVRLFEDWGIGRKGKDNGVLLLVAVMERRVKIEVGYGLEGAITDGTAGEIIRQIITPDFKKGLYDQGLLAGTEAILRLVALEYNVELPQGLSFKTRSGVEPERSSGILDILIFFGFLFVLFVLFKTGLWPLLFFGFPFGGGGWSRGGGGFGGGFGGFGGGLSGGGGASGSW